MNITQNSYNNGVIILLLQFKTPKLTHYRVLHQLNQQIFFGISNVAKSCDTRHKSEFYLIERIFFLSSGLIQSNINIPA